MPNLNNLVEKAKSQRELQQLQKEKDENRKLTMSQLDKLEDSRESVLRGFRLLIEFLDGKTNKTEIINQLDSISTPDVDKVVTAVQQLESTMGSKEQDLTPLTTELQTLINAVKALPQEIPEPLEQRDEIKVSNLEALESKIADLTEAFNQIDFQPEYKPEITVQSPKVTVPKAEVTVDNDAVAEALNRIADKIDAIEQPAFPTETLEKYLKDIASKLDWIGTRPIPMGVGTTTATTATVANVYDTAVYDTGTYS